MYRLITILSILVCFIPFIILFIKKLWSEKLYVLIALYWLYCALINITDLFNMNVSPLVNHYISLSANYTDVPIVLYIFYVASEGVRKEVIKITLLLFIAFEVLIILLKGFNDGSVTIVMGASLAVIILFGILGIVSYLSKIEHTPKENVMAFVYSSFLFFYGTFTVVYAFSYLANKRGDKDTSFLYYLDLLISCIPVIYALNKLAALKVNVQETRRKVEGF